MAFVACERQVVNAEFQAEINRYVAFLNFSDGSIYVQDGGSKQTWHEVDYIENSLWFETFNNKPAELEFRTIERIITNDVDTLSILFSLKLADAPMLLAMWGENNYRSKDVFSCNSEHKRIPMEETASTLEFSNGTISGLMDQECGIVRFSDGTHTWVRKGYQE